MSWFGAMHLMLVIGFLVGMIWSRNPWLTVVVFFFVYLFPVLCFRLHNWIYPLEEGLTRLDDNRYCPWWGGHRIQALFDAVPWVEALLRMIPGVFSLWLRMWGSSIGKGVYWTARVEITDRSLLEVGDGTVLGHKVACYAHVIDEKRSGQVLYVKRIVIGRGVFLGAASRLGPGAVVESDVVIPLLTDVAINQRVRRKECSE